MGNIGAHVLVILSITSYVAIATDPSQLQDFCVATKDPNGARNSRQLFHFCSLLSPFSVI